MPQNHAICIQRYLLSQVFQVTSPVKSFFWGRYVYDVIFAVSGNEAERLLSIFNSGEQFIQLTLEREKDRHLPFLDLNVYIGEQGNLETNIHRKPTRTEKYLAFDSHHPICHKKSVKLYSEEVTVYCRLPTNCLLGIQTHPRDVVYSCRLVKSSYELLTSLRNIFFEKWQRR